jgi:flagellar biosynthetic protein FliR
MFEMTDTQIAQFVGSFFFPLVRITAFLLAAPIFGTKIVTARVRVVLGVMTTIIVAPLLPPGPQYEALSLTVIIIIAQQILIGVALAFIFQVVFQVFVLAGQFIAMSMGLGFASMNDPANGVQVTIVSQFYLLTTTLLFLSVNGHLVLIQIIIDSFTVMPISTIGFLPSDYYKIIGLGGWMFASAFSIALPILTSLLVVNIAFGVMSRSAPQINVFVVGFPMTLIFGLFVMWLGFDAFLPAFREYTDQGFIFSQELLK